MVVVDKLTKTRHFILVKVTHKVDNIAEIYMREIDRLHGVPKKIVSNQYLKFTSNFWKDLFKGFGADLNFNTTYWLESDGKTDRINWIIEDMLRMYVMDNSSKWEDYIHLVDFAYNNLYCESLKMIWFETLNGIKWNTLVSWDNPTTKVVIGQELLNEMEEKTIKIR